jgi:hypothetical protein
LLGLSSAADGSGAAGDGTAGGVDGGDGKNLEDLFAWTEEDEKLLARDWSSDEDEAEDFNRAGEEGSEVEERGKGGEGVEGMKVKDRRKAAEQKRKQRQERRGRKDERNKLVQQLAMGGLGIGGEGAGQWEPRWRVGVLDKWKLAHDEDEDEDEEGKQQGRVTLGGHGRLWYLLRAAGRMIQFAVKIQRLAKAKDVAEEAGQRKDMHELLEVYFDKTRRWIAGAARIVLTSVIYEPKMQLDPLPLLDVAAGGGSGGAGGGGGSMLSKLGGVMGGGKAKRAKIVHARVLKLKVRVKGVLDALEEFTLGGARPMGGGTSASNNDDDGDDGDDHSSIYGDARDEGAGAANAAAVGADIGVPKPIPVLDFLGRLSADGVFYPRRFLWPEERKRMQFSELGASRWMELPAVVQTMKPLQPMQMQQMQMPMMQPVMQPSMQPMMQPMMQQNSGVISRRKLLLLNYLVGRLLVARVLLRPWEVGLGLRPVSKSSPVMANLRAIATVIFILLRRVQPFGIKLGDTKALGRAKKQADTEAGAMQSNAGKDKGKKKKDTKKKKKGEGNGAEAEAEGEEREEGSGEEGGRGDKDTGDVEEGSAPSEWGDSDVEKEGEDEHEANNFLGELKIGGAGKAQGAKAQGAKASLLGAGKAAMAVGSMRRGIRSGTEQQPQVEGQHEMQAYRHKAAYRNASSASADYSSERAMVADLCGYCPSAEHAQALMDALGEDWIDEQAKRLGRWADCVIEMLPRSQQQPAQQQQ